MTEHRGEGDSARRFLSALAAGLDSADHLDPDSQIYPYVEGRLDRAAREAVEAHLAICGICREDVGDLRAIEVQRRPSRRPWIIAASAAAAAAVAVIAIYLWTPAPAAPRVVRVQTVTSAPAPPPDPWHDMLRSAVAAGRLDEPEVLAALRRSKETLRGDHAQKEWFCAPRGVVVESARPRFSWAPVRGAAYRLSVLDGDRVVAQSPMLFDAAWESDRDLARGRVYSWQVEVFRGHKRTVRPDPASGDALFQVLDERAAQDVAAARSRFPDDHLLAGVLYAHYGVRGRAEEEMRLAAADPKRAADARRLADSIRHWQE